jgi:predicted secreted protein
MELIQPKNNKAHIVAPKMDEYDQTINSLTGNLLVPNEVVLREEHNGTTAFINAGGGVVITLEEQFSQGLKWIIKQVFPTFELYDESKKGIDGDTQKRVFRFIAGAGEGDIVLEYRNPWKPETAVVAEYRVHVIAK